MNTTAQALTFAIISVISATSIGMGLADHSAHVAQARTEVIHLERVVIMGKRTHTEAQVAMHMEQLPRVVIEGRRTEQTDVEIAGATKDAATV
jgi:cellobiose-specific phosphotransferase system component IIC